MRVISGLYKGKKIESPSGDSVRPTTDRIKESMFNILYSKIPFQDASVLDLFCGSGALGIESISRGAKSVIFCDKSIESLNLTKRNLTRLGIKNFEAYLADYQLAIKKLEGKSFDLIFLDPPYNKSLANHTIELIINARLLDLGGVLMIEHAGNETLSKHDCFEYDCRVMGKTYLTFVSHKAN